MADLFGDELVSYRTADGRAVEIKPRGKHYVEPRGYADRPGTGPAGETCGSCKHLYHRQMAKSYPKCALTRACWTGGRRSDVLVKAAACSKWEATQATD